MSAPALHLTAAADDRKARLAQLRAVKRKQPTGADPAGPGPVPDEAPAVGPIDVARTYLSGRNYDADTRGPKLGYDAPPNLALAGPTLEQQAAEIEAEVRQRTADAAADANGLDLLKLQPKKPNWYLRRHLDQRLEVLNVRTDNAIARLVRDRIASEQAQKREKALQDGGAVQANPLDGSPEEGLTPGESVQNVNEHQDGEADGLDGIALVEGLRVREEEEAEELRREREVEAEEEEAAMGD